MIAIPATAPVELPGQLQLRLLRALLKDRRSFGVGSWASVGHLVGYDAEDLVPAQQAMDRLVAMGLAQRKAPGIDLFRISIRGEEVARG